MEELAKRAAREALAKRAARGHWPGLGECLTGQGTVGLDETGATTVVFVLVCVRWLRIENCDFYVIAFIAIPST